MKILIKKELVFLLFVSFFHDYSNILFQVIFHFYRNARCSFIFFSPSHFISGIKVLYNIKIILYSLEKNICDIVNVFHVSSKLFFFSIRTYVGL